MFICWNTNNACNSHWAKGIRNKKALILSAFHSTGELNCLNIHFIYSGCGGLEVACWPLVPKFAGSHPAFGFLGWNNPQHGSEVKPSVPCRHVKDPKISAYWAKFSDISRPQFHLPPLGALAWWHAWRRLVAKVGTSNPDRTISLEGCSA